MCPCVSVRWRQNNSAVWASTLVHPAGGDRLHWGGDADVCFITGELSDSEWMIDYIAVFYLHHCNFMLTQNETLFCIYNSMNVLYQHALVLGNRMNLSPLPGDRMLHKYEPKTLLLNIRLLYYHYYCHFPPKWFQACSWFNLWTSCFSTTWEQLISYCFGLYNLSLEI